jgi:dTDP-4-amino-4,6-dideoxygalactose transaminase
MAAPIDAAVAPADPAAEYRELAGEIDAAVRRVLASGRYVLGPEGAAFEREMAQLVGTSQAIGVSSGTEALHLALRAAGVGPGDEVIVPAFTFVATAEAVSYTGARPVFADVDPQTFCLDPRSVEASLSARTRAVIAVHLFGQTAPIAEIARICRERPLTLVEDCAQALGADDSGKGAGGWGDFGCFSFYPTKTLAAAGDAGMITTHDRQAAQWLRMLRHHGQREPYVHEALGYNSRLDEIQAAILRVKLRHFERFTRARIAAARRYRDLLADAAVQLPVEHGRGRHVYHQFTLQCDARDALHAALTGAGIQSAIHYRLPLHRQPLYARDNERVHLPVAEALAKRVLCLPIHAHLSDEAIARVGRSVHEKTRPEDASGRADAAAPPGR